MRWALVGASDIAATRMIPAIRQRGDEVTCIVSGNAEHGRSFADVNGIAHYTGDLNAALADDSVQAVYISSRNHLHAEQAEAALKADKHVLLEKPVAVTRDDAVRLLEVAAQQAGVLAVNHHLPGAATHRTIRELIHSGQIGTPLAISICHAVLLPERLRGWRLETGPGNGVALDITCHDASVINPALKVPASVVTSTGASQGTWGSQGVDAVMTSMLYGSVTVQTHDAFTIGYRPTRFDVFGTEGAILASDVMTQEPIGDVVLRTKSGDRPIEVGERRDLYLTVLSAFARAVAGDGEPTVSGAAGANAFLVADAAQRAVSSECSVRIDHWFTDAPTNVNVSQGQHG
jgi:1,5-anhydro-D-fructose reductase (1,5-anhydro-D-mannitol-forming)